MIDEDQMEKEEDLEAEVAVVASEVVTTTWVVPIGVEAAWIITICGEVSKCAVLTIINEGEVRVR